MGLFSLNPRDPDKSVPALHESWINEIGELAGLYGAEAEGIKQVISRTKDVYRKPYQREYLDHGRAFIMTGTTNRPDGYLTSDNGNRRFVPIPCVGRIDLDYLTDDLLHQLYAEAVAEYRTGTLPMLSREVEREALAAQKAATHNRYEFLEDTLSEFIEGFEEANRRAVFAAAGSEEDLAGALTAAEDHRIPMDRLLDVAGVRGNLKETQEVYKGLRVVMKKFGYEKSRWRDEGKLIWGYRKK